MYGFLRCVVSFLLRVIYRVEVNGIENIPEGSFIISANHTHIFDPIVILTLTKRQINFVAKKEIFKYKLSNWIFTKLGVIPIDRKNNDLVAIKKAFRVLKSGGILGIFPEGTRVKSIDVNNMKKGVALIAIKNNVNIVPIHIQSSYKLFTKLIITVKKEIEISGYVNMEELEAIDKLTLDLFNSIYQ